MKFAVTDDFLGCGTEQLLLIPDGTTPVTNFILTDLMLHHLDSNQVTYTIPYYVSNHNCLSTGYAT